jgi:hypothetical protein
MLANSIILQTIICAMYIEGEGKLVKRKEGRKEGSTAGAEERAAAFKETGVVSKQ